LAQSNIAFCKDVPQFQEDGPFMALSEFMERNNNKAPDDWSGYRNIDEKDPEPSMSFMHLEDGADEDESNEEGKEQESD
jgi:hypothetical protein